MDLFNINYLLNISFLIVYFKSQLAELSNKQYDNFGKCKLQLKLKFISVQYFVIIRLQPEDSFSHFFLLRSS